MKFMVFKGINHQQIQGITSDKKTVHVALDTVLNQPLSGWIEVIGVPAANGTTINCSEVRMSMIIHDRYMHIFYFFRFLSSQATRTVSLSMKTLTMPSFCQWTTFPICTTSERTLYFKQDQTSVSFSVTSLKLLLCWLRK